LLLVPMIVSEWRQPSYMGDVITAMATIYACGYLVLVWMAFGIAKLVQRVRTGSVASLPRETNGDQTR
jgi:hypothetical protein